jgi:hypothetical protein
VLPCLGPFLFVVLESTRPEYVNLDLQVIHPQFGEKLGRLEAELAAEERRSGNRQGSS